MYSSSLPDFPPRFWTFGWLFDRDRDVGEISYAVVANVEVVGLTLKISRAEDGVGNQTALPHAHNDLVVLVTLVLRLDLERIVRDHFRARRGRYGG